MAPTITAPVDITTTLRTLIKRYPSSCDSYSTTCTPHRTAILIIIIIIGFLTACILVTYYIRKRASVHPGPSRFTPVRTKRDSTGRPIEEDVGLELPRYEQRGDAPPPYVWSLTKPENVHVHGART